MERAYSTTEARANFSQLVTEAGYAGREAIIRRNERPLAVIIGYEQYLEWRQQAGERAARFAVYDEIRAQNMDIEQEEVESEIAAALDAVRGS